MCCAKNKRYIHHPFRYGIGIKSPKSVTHAYSAFRKGIGKIRAEQGILKRFKRLVSIKDIKSRMFSVRKKRKRKHHIRKVQLNTPPIGPFFPAFFLILKK